MFLNMFQKSKKVEKLDASKELIHTKKKVVGLHLQTLDIFPFYGSVDGLAGCVRCAVVRRSRELR